jgi:hypothetical protein
VEAVALNQQTGFMRAHYFQQLKDRFTTLWNDRPVVVVIVISAVLLTGVRIIGPFTVGDDQALQLEASQRFVKGLGLTTTKTYQTKSNDILVVPPPKHLLQWPPGFSVLVASLLYVGLPLVVALKIIYGTVTLMGWIGWALIFSNFISRPVASGRRASWIYFMILALLPMVATPDWDGTDVFLWAGISFGFICLRGIGKDQPSLVSVACAGVLFGSLYAIRFTSLFLGLAAFLILFQVSYPEIKTFFKRFFVFLLSASTVMLPVKLYIMLHFERPQDFSVGVNTIVFWSNSSLIKAFLKTLLFTSNLVLGHPLLELVYRLELDWLTYSLGIICVMAVLALPVLLWRGASAGALKAKDDMALSLSFLPVSFLIFLMAAGFYFATIRFMLVTRYYEVVGLCGIFIFYELATRRATFGIVKLASKGILLFFIFYVCVALPAVASTKNGRRHLVDYASGFTPSRMFKLQTPRENARTKVEQLYKDNPEALFYASKYQWFTYDAIEAMPPPGINLRAVPDADFWTRAYTSKPVKVFWVFHQDESLDFIPDSRKQLIFSDSSERTKIVMSDFPAGPLVLEEHVAAKSSVRD